MKTKRRALGIGATILFLLASATAAAASNPNGQEGFSGKASSGHGGGDFDKGATIVSLESSPYGPVLVVGGSGAGFVPANPSTTPPTRRATTTRQDPPSIS